VESDWVRGINLETWLQLQPVYPPRSHVVDLLEVAKPKREHGDLKTHNIVFQGDGVQVIDWDDPKWSRQPDGALWEELVERVKG